MMNKVYMSGMLLLVLALFSGGCGNGTGVGQGELQKQEKKLWERLPFDWNKYNQGDYQGALDFFTETRDQADLLDDEGGKRQEIQSEALNGVGWAFLNLQDLDNSWIAFQQATRLNRQNTDAWVGWAGVALAKKSYSEAAQFSKQALETNSILVQETKQDYNSAFRPGEEGVNLGHDHFDLRHVRLMLAVAYFHLGRYSINERADPNNVAAQLRLLGQAGNLNLRDFKYRDPGDLLQNISQAAFELRRESSRGF